MSALPPYADLLGLAAEAQGDGPPLLVMPAADAVMGRPGFLHGGAISGLLEMAAIVALRHALSADPAEPDQGGTGPAEPTTDPSVRIKPVNVTVDFMRGGRDRPTRAAGVVMRLGGRVANVEAVAWQDARDKPIAKARMNYLLVRELP